jgi:hypothetical protein
VSVLTIVGIIGIVAYVIARQLLGEPLRGKRLLVLPAVLFIVGIADVVSNHDHHPRAVDIVILAIGAAVAMVVGVRQGRSMRLEARRGFLWGQMPVGCLWWWGLLVASRGVLDGVGYGLGAHVATGSAAILLTLGVNRLAQAAVVAPRALAADIPFAPEKDGTSLLSGIFGPGPMDRSGSPASGRASLQTSLPSQPVGPRSRHRHRPSASRHSGPDGSADNLSRQDWGSLIRQIVDHLDDRTR